MPKKILAVLLAALLIALIAPTVAFAVNVTLTLNPGTARPGDSVTASGTADADTFVPIKILDGAQEIVVFDAVKSNAQGSYSASFKVPTDFSGTALTVVAGYKRNVDTKILTVSGGSGDTAAPAWPAGSALTASSVTQNGLTLSWTAATDNVKVTNYRILKDGLQYKDVGSGTFTGTVSGLTADTSYTFKVEAGDAAGNWSSSGPSVTVTTAASTAGPGGGGPGGGGPVTPPPTGSSVTESASVAPADGGNVSLGSEVTLEIPAGALSGTTEVEVTIEKVSSTPAVPGGFSVLGSVFEFTVDGNAGYNFNTSVSLTFTFDPDALAEGETPAVYYYDETTAQWVNLGGVISGNTITVTVDHFTKFAVLAKEAASPADQPSAGPFSDVPADYWASGVIYELSGLGYISGYPDGSFKPGNRISRAEFATVLVKAFQLPAASGEVFDDTANHWARDYIGAAYAAGIVSGYSESSFGPDDPITREQMAVMIAKAAEIEEATETVTFTDSDEVSAWARGALAAVAQGGIMQGYPDGTFAPQSEATRAEAVAVISNALR